MNDARRPPETKDPRLLQLLRMRDVEKLTYREIAEKFGVSVDRARHLYVVAQRAARFEPDTVDELPSHVSGALRRDPRFSQLRRPEEIFAVLPELREAVSSSKRWPRGKGIKGFSKGALADVEAWLRARGYPA